MRKSVKGQILVDILRRKIPVFGEILEDFCKAERLFFFFDLILDCGIYNVR